MAMNGLIDFGIIKPELAGSFGAGFRASRDERNALARQAQAQQLGDIQLQNAMREQRMAGEEEAAYKTAGSDYAKLQSELMQRGLGKQAMAVAANQAKMQADKIAMLKGTTELMRSTATGIMSAPTIENALSAVQNFGQRTGTDVSRDIDMLLKIGNNPEGIKQWAAGHALEADKLLPKFQEFATPAGGKQIGAVNPVTGAFTASQTMAPEMTPAQVAQDARDRQRLGLESQRVGLERERVGIARSEADRKTQGLEALPPKEIQKREAVLPQATAAVKGFESKATSFVNDLKLLRDHPGLSQITGLVAGRVPALTAEGRAAQALYDKVVAKGGFQALQDMRDASKTGGALGNVSNQEGKQLTASFAAIDRRQDAKDVKSAINTAIDDIEGSKVRMREAYDSTYAYKAGKPAEVGVIDFGSLK
jgi:hypothetical protein